ncbi:twin-arginine translocase subunit TatC [Halalkalicoccus ordinarius]|uniref:twin-arginine translocase subunit TatC n=1 Tax=Halalkalicoccus ordinarius TaxID=3116651 RepID=UPI00300F261E
MSSSIVDEDTARSLNSGKESIGAVLSTAQTHLQKVFIIFVVGFLGTFYALRAYVWDWLKWVTVSEMAPEVAEEHEIIVQTPFEVILLQAKIGIVAGILIALPLLLYLSRHELRARGYWPQTPISRWKAVAIALLSLGLFVGGVVYAFAVFFPLILGFLATFSLGVGVTPTWSIVMWTEFLVLLTISFGLAAQLPLAMSSLAYIEVVPYETFRDKWRYAILGIFMFGALFSPPDPISQIMWALPLIVLYGFSLGLTRFIVNLKRGGRAEIGPTFRRNAGKLIGAPLLLAAALYAALVSGAGRYLHDELLAPRGIALPEALWLQQVLGVSREIALAVGAAGATFLLAFAVLGLYYLFTSVNVEESAGGRMGDPAGIDLAPLDAAGVRAAPDAAFEALSEEEALKLARSAIDDGEGEKAEAILERFDAAHEDDADGDASATNAETTAGTETGADAGAETAAGEGGVVQDTATGMFAAFSEEKDEDDIGGYIYDIKYIADSLRSRLFVIFAVFGLVLMGTFTFFYLGGVRVITEDFVSRMPAAIVSVEDFRIIDLHPVETLIFIIKVSTMLAALAILPMLLYYAWPAMRDRGLTTGQRSVVYEWTVAFVLALVGGTLLGYYYIAPGIIGFLVYDAVRGGMIISYQISKFSWLIIYTTVGVGLLACVPITMWMLFRGKVSSYRAMRNRWREMTIAVFAVSGVFTPISVLTMFLVAIPTMLAYGLGLAGLWVVTAGGRRDHVPPDDRSIGSESDEGSAKWLALILAILVLVGIGVVAGGVSSVVDDTSFGSDDPPEEPPLEEDDPGEPADDDSTAADDEAADENASGGDANEAEPAGSGSDDETERDEPNATDDDETDGDNATDGDNETDAAEPNDTENETDDADEDGGIDDGDDDGSGIDVREPIDG